MRVRKGNKKESGREEKNQHVAPKKPTEGKVAEGTGRSPVLITTQKSYMESGRRKLHLETRRSGCPLRAV